jgi:transcriptional regulator with XRE-family HTH domain
LSDPSATGAASGLGQRLRQARLDRGLSTTDLAAQLHMRPEQIDVLETGHTERWPERAFAIAQMRRLATAIGLDAESVVADLRPILDQVQTPSAAATAVMRASAARTGGTPVQRQRVFRAATPSRRPASATLTWMLLPLLLLGVGAIVVASLRSRREPAPAAAAVRTPAPRRTPMTAPVLEVSSSEPAWLTVRTVGADTVVFDGTFQGRRSFPLGTQGLELRSGRPDLVLVRQGDSPARALGPIDQINWVAFRPAAATAPAP